MATGPDWPAQSSVLQGHWSGVPVLKLQEEAMAKKRLRGVFSFTATPTRDAGATIDLDRLRTHLDWQIENGVHGIAVLGSTGSNGSFTEKEREELIKVATKHINGRVPLMAGTGSITTDEAVRMSGFAEDVGADAVIVVPITYWPLTDNEVYEHYSSWATRGIFVSCTPRSISWGVPSARRADRCACSTPSTERNW